MSDPVLQREAEVPRTRSTGGAVVVAVAFFSLFTALGASAFVVRVRMAARHCPSDLARLEEQSRRAAERAERQAAIAALEARSQQLAAIHRGPERVAALATADAPASGPVAVELLTRDEAIARAERQLDTAEREAVTLFRTAVARGDAEVALTIYKGFDAGSQARYVLERERKALADDWLATQVSRLDRELAQRDCGAVTERLERISRLLPDRHLPTRMAGCE